MALKKEVRLSQRGYDDPEKARPRNKNKADRQIVVDRLAGKLTKEEAAYRNAPETESKQMCAECVHYLIPGQPHSSCRRVAGIVAGEDTCDIFAARSTEFGQGH